jgi:Abortive infection bacteriophage resistance protein
MEYVKQPLTIQQQIQKLESRGLIVDDKDIARNYLQNISYYRLRAYTYPFQDNYDPDADHRFVRKDIHFADIIDLYCFDRRLRALLFNAIEKIEVAFRTKITYEYAIRTMDSHWFMDESLFKDDYYKETDTGKNVFKYNKLIDDIQYEVDRSNEDFIKHYQDKYTDPAMPPSWMALEVVSFGTLSKLYELLKKDESKILISKSFGINNIAIMENWLHAISNLRNCCAHHSRIWNRRFVVGVKLPYNTDFPFMDRDTISKTKQNKLFAILSCIKYIIDTISPDSDFKKNFISILNGGGKLLSMKEMGFPENWQYLDVWKNK